MKLRINLKWIIYLVLLDIANGAIHNNEIKLEQLILIAVRMSR